MNIAPISYAQPPAFKGRILNKPNMNYTTAAATSASLLTVGASVVTPSMIIPSIVLGALSYLFLYISRHVKEKPIQLKPKIEYKESKTIEDAAKFAKNNFRIKKFKVDDLEIANWINEGLTVLSNKFKGSVYMPRKVEYKQLKLEGALASYQPGTDTLFISKVDESLLDDKLPVMVSAAKAVELDKMHFGTWQQKFVEDLENYKTLSKMEKQELYRSIITLLNFLEELLDNNHKIDLSQIGEKEIFGPLYLGKFGVLFHEMGHVFDRKSANSLDSKKKLLFEKESKDLILNDYASSDYQEFIADVFAGIMSGDKYPDEVLRLFSKLTTIKFPED